MRVSFLEPSLVGKGGGDKKSPSPSPPQKSSRQPQVDPCAFLKPLLILAKKPGAQKQAALPASATVLLRLPLLPSLQAFLVWFRTSFWLVWWVSNLYCKPSGGSVRQAGHRGDGEGPPSALSQDCGDAERLRHFFKKRTIARLILLFILLSFPNNRNTA